jgi:ABC-2 type transport system ATP-binding protein
MNMIDVECLTKRFGQFTAVDSISFQVDKGEIFGLLGPNGAGKTTTIRCLLTLIPLNAGKAKVADLDVAKKPQQVREACGYVPQDVSVDGDLTGYENILFYAELFHVPKSVRRERIRDVIRFMELTEKVNELARNYSGGMMRRLEIGQVLVNRGCSSSTSRASVLTRWRNGWSGITSTDCVMSLTPPSCSPPTT